MTTFNVYLWKKAPAIRLLLPFIAGIVLQWYGQLSWLLIASAAVISLTGVAIYKFLPVTGKWRFSAINGSAITLLCAAAGALLVYINDIRHHSDWVGAKNSQSIMVTLQEPLVEKANSYKAIASVTASIRDNKKEPATGSIIVYFKKDSAVKQLGYGSQLIIDKPLQLIKNSGNPGGFDYQQYNLFQGITHQVNVNSSDFVALPETNSNSFNRFIFGSRHAVVTILRKYIKGEQEQGLAEALLIGYKDDLDKNLVQSYSNTGVVHIIAISGLHLGLIYWILLLLTKPLKRTPKTNWIRFLMIITGLWLFSILAGGQPSVLRSAVMFSFIALAEVLNRRTSIYNTLALSALLLLCYDPFWWWDVGFQLSYTAVLSIVIFFRPIYNWLFFKNKAVDFVWKLTAVTLAAQIFTIPISLYHFHQFPVLFLLANLLAVPLSSIILIGEIIVVILSFIPFAANLTGVAMTCLLRYMNEYIEQIDSISFATWNDLSISLWQTILLLGAIAGISFWLLRKEKTALQVALSFLVAFTVLRTVSFIEANQQQKLIVYNVPKYQAIDVINGRKFTFVGDSELLYDGFLRNFHLQPSRILHRIEPETSHLTSHTFQICNKRIAILDSTVSFLTNNHKPVIDVLVFSKNPKVYMTALCKSFTIHQVVIDGSVPMWKAKLWKRDCDSLHIPYHDVTEKGAFVMNL